jgi:hypothetical protein
MGSVEEEVPVRTHMKLCSVIATLAFAACSDPSSRDDSRLTQQEQDQCTFTQGYWENHPAAWPVDSLVLGDHEYTQAELLQILDQPVAGNGLIALAHQLIAAKPLRRPTR